jgi:hypothetical protein
MDYFRSHALSSDDGIVAAWESVATTEEIPSLRQVIAARGAELFPEFSKRYAEIRALPRNARRALQRRLADSRELATIPHEWRRKLAYSVAGAALLLALSNNNADAFVSIINVGPGCTLTQAIESSNNHSVVGSCTQGTGTDTIVLPAKSTQTLTTGISTVDYGATGLPTIASTSNITIEGNGSKISRKSKTAFRLITVASGGTLTLKHATLSGGSADKGGAIGVFGGSLYIEDCTITGNTAKYYGGGIYIYDGIATIDPTTISKNTARVGGAIMSFYSSLTISNSTITGNRASYGGGIANQAGTLVIEDNSIISKNSANYGGGINNLAVGKSPNPPARDSKVEIHASTITGNKSVGGNSGGYGAGIFSNGEQAEVDVLEGSVISKNISGAGGGGGIANIAGEVHVYDSTVTGNKTVFAGGGIFSFHPDFVGTNEVKVNNSTISSNVASIYGGGGIFVQNGPLTLIESTISSNKTSGKGGGVFTYSSTYNNFAADGDTFLKNVAGHGGADFYHK